MTKDSMNNRLYKTVLTGMLAVIVVLLCVSCYLLGVAHGRSEIAEISEDLDRAAPQRTVVNKENIDKVAAGMKKKTDRPQNYEVIMNTEWVFDESGMAATNAYVENSHDNSNTVRFTLTLESEPDSAIYISPEIKVGERFRDIKLSSPLPEGSSRAVVTYQLLDESGRISGEVKAGVTLIR